MTKDWDCEPRDLDWNNLSFRYTPCEYLVVCEYDAEGGWSEPKAVPHEPLKLEPSAAVLNYGQGIFEGMKAFRQKDGGIRVFRPEMHASRAQRSAARVCIPEVPVPTFIKAVKMCAAQNASYVPPCGSGSLYVRPLIFGDEAQLGVRPSATYKMCVYASPVGPFFASGTGIKILCGSKFHRSYPKGVGRTKAPGNYAPCTMPKREAFAAGFHELLFLDGESDKFVEECSGSNFFALVNGVLRTPSPHKGTLLDGITRDSLLYLAANVLKLPVVSDEDFPVELLKEAEQAFCSGTAAKVTAVGSVTLASDPDNPIQFKSVELGNTLRALMTDIQSGDHEAPEGWFSTVTSADLAIAN